MSSRSPGDRIDALRVSLLAGEISEADARAIAEPLIAAMNRKNAKRNRNTPWVAKVYTFERIFCAQRSKVGA